MADAPPHVYKAIAAVTAALSIEGISKDRRNQQQGYAFRGIDDVYNQLSPILAKNDLCVLPRVISRECVERQTAKGGALFYVTVEAEFDLVSAVDGSRHTIRTFGEAMDTADKATNKAMSAAYKYAAMQAFCIPTEGDNDSDAVTHEVVAQPPKPKAQSRDTFDRLSKKNRELANVEDFDRFWTDERVIEAYNSLPTDWRNQMAEEREEKGNALVSKPEPRTYVAPNFDEARQ